MNSDRIVFDLSTSMRWTGPPVGIVRVERELARWARDHLPNVAFAFFDPERQIFRKVCIDVHGFLVGEAVIDTLGMTSAARPGGRRTDLIPARLKPAIMGLLQLRRTALRALERIRLKSNHSKLSHLADRLQRRIMSDKYRRFMVRPDGSRRPFLPSDLVLGDDIELCASDTLICAGSGWGHTNIAALQRMKAAAGFRMVLLCYDLIPLLFPHFYHATDVDLFATYMTKALAIADLVAFSSSRIEGDVQSYCGQHGIALKKTVIVPFGFDRPRDLATDTQGLPSGLQPGHFVLLVSTIEPRKGHAMIYRIWLRLLAEGVIQARKFKLVFAGRPGWKMEAFMTRLYSSEHNGTVLHLANADDHTLNVLYDTAAFCVYPSEYEGYGLPVLEAFAHGRAVLASTGGALPEVVKGLSPCLDPHDEDSWYRHLKAWILDQKSQLTSEQAVQRQFSHMTWSEASRCFFSVVGSLDKSGRAGQTPQP